MGSFRRACAVLILILCAGPVSAASWTPTASGGGSNATVTALYDGTVLVAGGGDGSPPSASARIYDPTRGLWRNVAPLAQARLQAAAVMLRDGRVLVTGGLGTSGALGSVEIYDPVSAQWSPGPPMGEPRRLHTATLLDDGRVLVTAGITTSGWLATAEIFDPVSDTWSATGSVAVPRYDHSATRLRDGRVLIAAGTNQSFATGALASVEIYDPVSGTWTSGGTLTHRRQRHTATLLNDGRVLVAGGLYYASSTSQNATFPGPCEIFNPATNTWTIAGSLLTPRSTHSATLLPDSRVLVAGGMTPNWETAAAEVYSPSSNSWSTTASLPAIRANHHAIVLPGGRVLVIGGSVAFGSVGPPQIYDAATPTTFATGNLTAARYEHSATLLPSGKVLAVGAGGAEAFDPAGAGTWSAVAAPGVFRRRHTATLLPAGQVLLAGGSDGTTALASAQLYNPQTNVWTDTGGMFSAREEHAATLLPDGRVLVTGGANAGGTLSGAEVYDPEAGTWSDVPSLPEPRRLHSATLLLSGKVLVAGGHSGGGALNSSTLFDPQTGLWTPTATNLTTPRYGHTATLMGNGEVLVAGGMGASTWVQTSELFMPASASWTFGGTMATARWKHSSTLLPDGRVFVAGGAGAAGALASTEVYDPTRTPNNARWVVGPGLGTGRQEHTATLLANGNVLVAGGFNTAALNTARLFVLLGSFTARPTLTSANDPVVGGVFSLTGSGFLGRSPGSMGTCGMDSPADYPLVQIRRLDNGAFRWAAVDPLQPWSDTSFVSGATPGLHSGHALVTVFVNGQPSLSRITSVRAANGLPVARPGGPYSGSVGEAIAFDGTASSDPDGDPLEYAWDFGDGATGSGASPSHTYAGPGVFTVTLVVNDGFASSAPATTTATVTSTRVLSMEIASAENGAGQVALDPAGSQGSCANDPGQSQTCSSTQAAGTVVTLTATADPDSKFMGWTGSCSGTDPVCQVTLTEDMVVGATFLGPRTLRVNVVGMEGGHGVVQLSPASLGGDALCDVLGPDPVQCTFLYPPDTTVQLVATPASDAKFLGWLAECSGNGPCAVTLDGGPGSPPKFVVAEFLGPRVLQVTVGGLEGGRGVVQVSPPPIGGFGVCDVLGPDPVQCNFLYPPDTTVQLVATPASDAKFLGWLAECSGTGPCAVTLDGGPGSPPKFVVAEFLGPRVLLVTVVGLEGSRGLVQVSPAPLSGGGSCEASGPNPVQCVFLYPPDTQVTLAAQAAAGSGFVGWQGLCSEAGPCALTLSGGPGTPPAMVTATFEIPNQLPTAVPGGPYTGVRNQPVAFNGSASSDPDGDPLSYTWDFGDGSIGTGVAPSHAYATLGTFTVTLFVSDGLSSSWATTVVTILNLPPEVQLTSPPDLVVAAAPVTVPLAANASDPDGSVAKVEFYAGSTLLGEDTVAPFAFSWEGVAAGTYVLTAVATDDSGATGVSAPVTLRVATSLAATADAHVRDGGSAGSNFGSSASLEVKVGTSGNTRWTYLKFNTTGLATVQLARLRLFGNLSATTSTVVRTQVFRAANTSWTEGGIRWNNRPSTASSPLAAVTLANNSTAPQWYEWDVTSYLQQEKAAGRHIVTLVLKNDVSTSPFATFRSRQASGWGQPALWVVP